MASTNRKKSALKKNRQDIKRTKLNATYKKSVKTTVKKMVKGKSKADDVKKAYSLIDKAAKKKVIHKNKAARLKSKVAKLVTKKKS